MTEVKEQLHDIIWNGLQINIYEAEEALALNRLIGTNADPINRASFGDLFGTLQRILVNAGVLAVTRLYERPIGKYAMRTIPAAIQLLKSHAEELEIEQRRAVVRKLVQHGGPEGEVSRLEDSELTKRLASNYEDRLPRPKLAHIEDSARALYALKARRDKVIAHSEAVRESDLPEATYRDIHELISYAKDFMGTVAFGYLSIMYSTPSGTDFLSRDTEFTRVALDRLLRRAGILTDCESK